MQVHYGLTDLPTFRNTVLTVGSFDGVHRGHQQLLRRINDLAREVGGESVLITFDPHPRQVIFPKDKSLQLLTTTEEKLELLAKYGVDHVVVIPFSIEFSQQYPAEYIEKVLVGPFAPTYIVIGYDHRFGLNRQGDIHLLKQHGKEADYTVIEVEKQQIEDIAISSSKIRTSLTEGDIVQASLLAGHAYQVSGTIVDGDKIGTTIGYPTANLLPEHHLKLVPAHGVYAVRALLQGDCYDGMLYIGVRPTIHGKDKQVIEVHLFDFDDSIYGERLTLIFEEYVRGDISFDSLDALSAQLGKDKVAVQSVLGTSHYKQPQSLCTIAILNYNGQGYLESYLPSILESSADMDFDILVIDNASTDDSVPYVKEWHPEVRVRELQTNYGFAGGYNKGLQGETAKYLAIINSDVLVTEGWLDPLVRLLELNEDIGAVQPKIRSMEQRSQFEYAGAAGGLVDRLGYPFCRGRVFNTCEDDDGQYDSMIDVSWTSGACMLIRRELFEGLGGFDADYFAHHEEIDLCYRMRRAGYRLICQPESVVYHVGGGTLEYESPRKTLLNFRNNHQTLIKNERTSKLLWLLPLRISLDKVAAVMFLIDGYPKNAAAVLKALWQTYSRLPSILRKRRSYRRLIQKHQRANAVGPEYGGSVMWSYFVQGKKHYNDII